MYISKIKVITIVLGLGLKEVCGLKFIFLFLHGTCDIVIWTYLQNMYLFIQSL